MDALSPKENPQKEFRFSAHEWAEKIVTPVVEKLDLTKADLIIEAGVGTGRIMPEIIREVFPLALYVGTEPKSPDSQEWTERSIRPEYLQKVLNSQNRDRSNAVLRADCYDKMLINDLAQKTGKHNPLLVSFNALGALMTSRSQYERIIFMEEKARRLIHEVPYFGQVHLSEDLVDLDADPAKSNIYNRSFITLANEATGAGWIIHDLKYGFAIRNPSFEAE